MVPTAPNWQVVLHSHQCACFSCLCSMQKAAEGSEGLTDGRSQVHGVHSVPPHVRTDHIPLSPRDRLSGWVAGLSPMPRGFRELLLLMLNLETQSFKTYCENGRQNGKS